MGDYEKYTDEGIQECIDGYAGWDNMDAEDLCRDLLDTRKALAAATARAEEAEEKEQGRWQEAIWKLCTDRTGEDIDGGGCDSGDPLDLSLDEISQAINHFQDELHEANVSRDQFKAERDEAKKSANEAYVERDFAIIGKKEAKAKLKDFRNEVNPILDKQRERLTKTQDHKQQLCTQLSTLRAALEEGRAALYGAREACGNIGNIQHAIDLADKALAQGGAREGEGGIA